MQALFVGLVEELQPPEIAVQTQAQQNANGSHSTAARTSAVCTEGVAPSARSATRSFSHFLPRVCPERVIRTVS
ncbi:hypothetical protein SHIRM173S_05159 [Streptomyces hirsutus]